MPLIWSIFYILVLIMKTLSWYEIFLGFQNRIKILKLKDTWLK